MKEIKAAVVAKKCPLMDITEHVENEKKRD